MPLWMAGPHMEGQTFNCIGAKLRGAGNILLNWLGRYDLPGPGWQLFSGIFSPFQPRKILQDFCKLQFERFLDSSLFGAIG